MSCMSEPSANPTVPTAENVGVVTRYASAWQQGDLAVLADCYADDVVVHYGGQSSFAGIHRGRDRLSALLVDTAAPSS